MEENGMPPVPPPVPPSPEPAAPPRLPTHTPVRQQKPGTVWKVLTFVLLALLLMSVLYNLGGFFVRFNSGPTAMGGRTAGPKLQEVLTEDSDAHHKIAVIKIEGIITSSPQDGQYTMVELIKAQLAQAAEDDKVKAVILKVDSPGGEVLASDEIYRLITDFQDKHEKPVVASMGNLAASGGYYVSAPCRWIVANELTITGSIGVILQTWNYRGLMDKVGVAPQIYKSGRFKDMLSGARPLSEISPEEVAMVQALIDETYSKFKEVVASGREQAFEASRNSKNKNRTLSKDWTQFADGRVLSGSEAFRLGFVDELGNFEDAVKRAENLANIANANLIEYQQLYNFSDLFRLFGNTESPSIKVDFGVEAPKLRAGQLYFLTPEFAN